MKRLSFVIEATPKTHHAYEVEVRNGSGRAMVEVHANNRDQAARAAAKAGYAVCSVNMIG